MPGTNGDPLPKPGAFVAAIRYTLCDLPDPVVVGKPSQHLFNAALQRLRLSPEQVVMIGDGLETDVAGGRRAGIHTVWLHRGRTLPNEAELFAVRDLSHFHSLLWGRI